MRSEDRQNSRSDPTTVGVCPPYLLQRSQITKLAIKKQLRTARLVSQRYQLGMYLDSAITATGWVTLPRTVEHLKRKAVDRTETRKERQKARKECV